MSVSLEEFLPVHLSNIVTTTQLRGSNGAGVGKVLGSIELVREIAFDCAFKIECFKKF